MHLRAFPALFALILVAIAAPFAAAQVEDHSHPETGRTPAEILPAERAGLLLLEARDDLERPDITLDLLGLKDGDLVADIGCGNGYYTLRLAERIAPHGHVFAIDVQQGMLDQLEARMQEAGIRNVYPILGAFEDPYLPTGKIDWMLLVDVYHEFSDPQAMLARMREALAPDGKVALLEYRAEQDPATISFPIPPDHKMSVNQVLSEWEPAGFRLVERVEVLPAQHIFIFEAGDAGQDAPIRSMRVGDTENVSTWENGKVYFSAQPSESDLKHFAALGVKTVVNLRTPEEVETLEFEERAVVEDLKMTYVNVPVSRALPDNASLQPVFELLSASDTPVLVHCSSSNRAGAVWGLYQLTEGASPDEAVERAKQAGMRAEAFEEQIRARTED